MPIRIIISEGQALDIGKAELLLDQDKCEYLLAGKGQDSDNFRKELISRNIKPVIHGRSNRIA